MNQQLIEQAIRSKSVISFSYSNRLRVAEPHVLGIKDGKLQFLGYQIGGSSSSGGLPEWRRFDLEKMSALAITQEAFPGRRPTKSGTHGPWDIEIVVVDA